MNLHQALKDSLKVGVFGSEGDHCSPRAEQIAYEVGRLLAAHQAIVFTGGGSGVMAAAAAGASEAGGFVIGVLPGDNTEDGHDVSTLLIPTGMGFARSQILTCAVDAAILVEGGSGTHQEAAFMFWRRKPIVAISTSGGTAALLAGKPLDRRNAWPVLDAKTADEAVALVMDKPLLKRTSA